MESATTSGDGDYRPLGAHVTKVGARYGKRDYVGGAHVGHKRWAKRWIPPLLFCLLAFILRAWNLDSPSLWYDEAYTWWISWVVPPQKTLAFSIRETVPPLTYFMLRGWIAVAGETEFALRMPSVLLGILTVAASGRAVWRLTGQRRGAIAAWGTTALATPLLWAARDARLYGPLLGFTMLANVALLETLLGPPKHRQRWAWAWGCLTLAALYSLVLAGFWLIGQGCFTGLIMLLYKRQLNNGNPSSPSRDGGSGLSSLESDDISEPTLFKALWPPALVAALLYAPWAIAALRALEGNVGYWAGYLPPSAFFATTVRGITVSDFLPPHMANGIGALVILATTLPFLITLSPKTQATQLSAALYPLLYGLPPLALLSYLFREIPKWGTRHTLIFAPLPSLALAVGWGLRERLTQRTQRLIATLVLSFSTILVLSVWIWGDVNLLTNPYYGREDWRSAVEFIQSQRETGDVVIVETGAVFPTWLYYARNDVDPFLPLPADELLDVTHVLHYTDAAPQLNAALANAHNVWLITWLDEVTDPTGIVPTLLLDIGTENVTPAFHGLGVRHFTLTETPTFPPEPPATIHPHVELLPDLWLWGARLPQSPIPADTPFELWTWWTTENPATHVARFYQMSLSLTDSHGDLWARIDAPPGGGDYRPEHWPLDTPVLGPVTLTLPPGLPPGPYTTTLTLYRHNQTSPPLTLGQVVVTRPTTVPAVPKGLTRARAQEGTAPLTLLGIGLDRPKVAPCETLSGLLFWEAQARADTPYEVTVRFDTYTTTFTLTPDFPPPRWHIGDRYASRFKVAIPCRAREAQGTLHIELRPKGTAQHLARWEGPQGTIKTARHFDAPTDIYPLSADAGDGLATLLGYRLTPDLVHAGDPFTLTLYWRAEAATDVPYTVFVHVTSPEAPGTLNAQHDSWPAQGTRATYTWVPGEVIADAHPLEGLPAGGYELRVGLYDPTVTRLRLYTAEGPVPDNALTIPMIVREK